MQKLLVGLALVAVVLAVGVVVAIAYFRGGGRGLQPVAVSKAPVDDAPKDSVAAEPMPAPKPAESAPDTLRVQPAAVAPEPVLAEATPAPAPVERTVEQPSASEVSAQITKLLDSLSAAEEQELMRQIRERQIARFREQQRYNLPSDWRLQRLNWGRDSSLKLSDAQQQQVAAIKDALKPQIDAALGALWAKEEDLRAEAQGLRTAGRTDEADLLWQELRDTHVQIEAARNEIDKQYQQMLTAVLTPEQAKSLENVGTIVRWGRGSGGRDAEPGGPPAPRP